MAKIIIVFIQLCLKDSFTPFPLIPYLINFSASPFKQVQALKKKKKQLLQKLSRNFAISLSFWENSILQRFMSKITFWYCRYYRCQWLSLLFKLFWNLSLLPCPYLLIFFQSFIDFNTQWFNFLVVSVLVILKLFFFYILT